MLFRTGFWKVLRDFPVSSAPEISRDRSNHQFRRKNDHENAMQFAVTNDHIACVDINAMYNDTRASP